MKIGESIDWVKELIENAKANMDSLSGWQRDFIYEYAEKVEYWDESCFISVKQLEQLNKIAEALGTEQIDSEQLDND